MVPCICIVFCPLASLPYLSYRQQTGQQGLLICLIFSQDMSCLIPDTSSQFYTQGGRPKYTPVMHFHKKAALMAAGA